MKKVYQTPTMKVTGIEVCPLICGSPDDSVNCFRGESVSSDESDNYSDMEGYGEDW